MELERKVTIYEKSPWKRAETYGEWQTRSGDISIPKISTAAVSSVDLVTDIGFSSPYV